VIGGTSVGDISHYFCSGAFQVNKTKVILFPSSGAEGGGGMGKIKPLTAPLYLRTFPVNKTRGILLSRRGRGKTGPLAASLFVKILIQLIRPEEYGHWARRDH
jgi:hypothetical protein